jgi:hypothetical protein
MRIVDLPLIQKFYKYLEVYKAVIIKTVIVKPCSLVGGYRA